MCARRLLAPERAAVSAMFGMSFCLMIWGGICTPSYTRLALGWDRFLGFDYFLLFFAIFPSHGLYWKWRGCWLGSTLQNGPAAVNLLG